MQVSFILKVSPIIHFLEHTFKHLPAPLLSARSQGGYNLFQNILNKKLV